MRILTLIISLGICSLLHAQDVDYEWVIPPLDKPNISLEEKLIALAWKNYPENKMLQHELGVANAKVELADQSWTQGLNVNSQFSLGSGGDTLNSPQSVGLRTGVGIGLSLNIGALSQRKTKVKSAVEEARIAEEKINMQKFLVRTEVLKRYQDYRLATELLRLRTIGLDDIYSGYLSVQNLYKQGEIELLEYNQVLSTYNKAQEAKIEAEKEVIVARRALEELIGVPWDQVQ